MTTYNEDLADAAAAADATGTDYEILLGAVAADAADGITYLASKELISIADASIAALTQDIQQWHHLMAGAAAADTTLPEVLANLIERIVAATAVDHTAILAGVASDAMTATDAAAPGWQLALTDAGDIADDVVGIRAHIMALADALRATGAADGQRTALVDAVSEAVVQAVMAEGWSLDAADSSAVSDAVVSYASYFSNLVSAGAASDAVAPGLTVSLIAADSGAAVDSVAAAMSMLADLSSEALVYASIRLGDGDFSGWVMNTRNKAASQYTNIPFESLATFRGRTYGAGDGGIYEMTGSDDDGANIESQVVTGLLDLGLGVQKRGPELFFAVTGDGRLLLKVVTTQATGNKTEDWYLSRADSRVGTAMREGRFTIGRGLKSRYWQYTLTNVDGGTLDLTGLQWHPLLLDRRC